AARTALGSSASARRAESQPRGATAPRAQQGSRLGGTMSRPRFLADNDLNDAIDVGVLRREPQPSSRGFETSAWQHGATPRFWTLLRGRTGLWFPTTSTP